MNNRWFANRGQVIQTVLAVIACVFAGAKALPDFQRSQFLTVGSMLFIFIAASVIVSFVQFALTVRSQHPKMNTTTEAHPPDAAFTAQYRGKLFSCSSGISRIGKGGDKVWTSIGQVNAAVAALKNEANKPLRDVKAYADFYDEKGRQIAFSMLSWVDEEHDNTGFAAGGVHSLVFAIHENDTDRYFLTTDGKQLEGESIAITLRLYTATNTATETIRFSLPTRPYLALTTVVA